MTAIPNAGVSPQPDPARWSLIPALLRERPQWAVAAHGNKRPLTTDGRPASTTDPSTWGSFEAACAYATAIGGHPGFMLHASDPFSCIDMDVKDHTPPERIARYERMVEKFDSYTEQSRSGRGLHVWVEGKIGRGRRDDVEVYSQERFIICTGAVFRDRAVSLRQELLGQLLSEMNPPADAEANVSLMADGPDYELAYRAAADAGEMGMLWAGDWQGRYPSQSEADLELVKLLLPHADTPGEC